MAPRENKKTKRINPRIGTTPIGMGMGQLVFVGPTCHRDGRPVKYGQIPNSHLFVAWCAANATKRLLRRLQQGNPHRLVTYGAMPTTLVGAKHLCSRWASDHVRGHWYRLSPSLLKALYFARGESLDQSAADIPARDEAKDGNECRQRKNGPSII